MANSGSNSLNFIINVSGNAFAGVPQLNMQVGELTATINNQVGALKTWGDTAFSFNNILGLAKTAISAVTGAVGGWENAYKARATAESQLTQAMHNTMGATRAEVNEIIELTNAQQKLGVVSSATQIASAKELGTYVTKSESLKTLIPVMNDMLAHQHGINATQEQAVGIAQMVGKVLDGQSGALSRAGYRFTEAQKAMLETGNEQERVALLSEIITKSVGGMNEALANTPEGRLKQHANTMLNFQERIGKVVVSIKSAMLPVFDKLNVKIEQLLGWIEKNFDTIEAVCLGAATAIGVAFDVVSGVVGGAIDVFKWFADLVGEWYPLIAGLGVAIGGLAVVINLATIKTAAFAAMAKVQAVWSGIVAGATKVWTGIQWALNAALTANPIGLIVVGIAALVTAVVLCWQKFAGFRAFILTMWDTIKGFGGIIKQYVIDRIKGLLEGVGAIGRAIAALFNTTSAKAKMQT